MLVPVPQAKLGIGGEGGRSVPRQRIVEPNRLAGAA